MIGYPSRAPYALHAVLGSLALASASPAFSECATAASVPHMTKAEVILGGAPSRLAEMQARQSISAPALASAQPDPMRAPASPTYLRNAAIPVAQPLLGFALAPSYGEPNQPEMIPSPTVGGSANIQPAIFSPSTACALPPRSAESASSGATHDEVVADAPDIFGTVALAIGRTMLDDKWQRVSSQRLPAHGPWNAVVNAARSMDRRTQIAFINQWVNARIHYSDDAARNDQWASAARSLRRERGDCEDYAIAKLQLLNAAGVPGKDLLFVIVRDLVRRADHAVLGVRLDNRVYILDNMTDRVLPSGEIADYRPVLTFSSAGRWTHGYRRLPAVQLASIS